VPGKLFTLGGGLSSFLFCRKFTNLHAPRTNFWGKIKKLWR